MMYVSMYDVCIYLIAMNPRFLNTMLIGEDGTTLAPVSTSVRVGLAVETVGLAGRPKTITGFQVLVVVILIFYFVLRLLVVVFSC